MELLNLPLETELLSPEEIAQLTGRSRRDQQIRLLADNGWMFWRNAAGIPVVGRLYARFKLGGIELSHLAPSPGVVHWDEIR